LSVHRKIQMTSNANTFEIHASDADHLLHDGYIGSPKADKPLIYEFRLSDLRWPEVKRVLDLECIAYKVNGHGFNKADW